MMTSQDIDDYFDNIQEEIEDKIKKEYKKEAGSITDDVATSLIITTWASDNLNLKQRLKINKTEVMVQFNDLTKTVDREISNLEKEIFGSQNMNVMMRSIKVLAKDNHVLRKQLKTALENALQSTKKLDKVKSIEGIKKDALEEISAKILRNIEYRINRVLVTEKARACFLGFKAKFDKDDKVIGYKWNLVNHPKEDICDEHATANFYGMGTGIYPKNKVPSIPQHPHCRCKLTPVYKKQ